MAYEFKKLSAVEAVETPADTANVLIEEDGVIKRTPKSEIGATLPDNILTYDKNNPPAGVNENGVFTGSGNGDSAIVNVELTLSDNTEYWTSSLTYDEMCAALEAGKFLNVMLVNQAGPRVRYYYVGRDVVETDDYLVFANLLPNVTYLTIGSGNTLYPR